MPYQNFSELQRTNTKLSVVEGLNLLQKTLKI